ncbi:hypothetical protein ACH4C2_35780 [Streptomyces sp. NPDC018057]|uniref:hypothetical protein n=1 Tax=unclassified Streptomyces TaxID=2593676 RepID=UPI0037A9A385
MFVFVCVRCGAELTVPLSEVALPVHARQRYGNGIQLPVLMEAGTFAVDPDPWGPPWRLWDELGPGEAEARGIHAPVHALSDAIPGAIVTAPGDIRGTRLAPGEGGGGCCGLDGSDGPDMACEACGLPVASRIDDCSLWQAVRLAPDAVRRVLVDAADPAPLSWEELRGQARSTPLFEPIATWSSLGTSSFWSWSPRWEAAAGRALAQLLAASGGRRVTVPDGLVADVFRRALDTLLPGGRPERHAVLAGPGLPAPEADADLLIVPVHPRTGRWWSPDGPAAAARPGSVPLPLGVWLGMAAPPPYLPVPASGGLPHGVLRDDPLPPHPSFPFRADRGTFEHTLVRLPAARGAWVRDILGNLTRHMADGLF